MIPARGPQTSLYLDLLVAAGSKNHLSQWKESKIFRVLASRKHYYVLPQNQFFEPSAGNLPGTFRKTYRKTFRKTFCKNLPQNLPQTIFWMRKGRVEGPEPSGILPESSRKPSAEKPFTKTFCKTFRRTFPKNLPQSLPQNLPQKFLFKQKLILR